MDHGTAEAITAWGTAIGALATAVMAFFTWRAIRNGQDERKETNKHYAETRKQENEHHQDAFRPLVVLAPHDVMSTLNRNDVLSPDPNGKTLMVKLIAHNVGTGPALNIQLSVRSEGRTGFGPSRALAPLAAGANASNDRHYILIDVNFTDSFNFADLANISNGHWVIVLEYDDIFGNRFYTLHSHHPHRPWIHVGRGQAPDTTPLELNVADPASFAAIWAEGGNPSVDL
jgi:hypothetical protein